MKIKQFQVKVIPRSGQPFHVYVGDYTRCSAHYSACRMYPDASIVVLKQV